MGYTLFGKPVAVLASVLAGLAAVYLLPEYWPDHAAASQAIRRNDTDALRRYLARGLSAEERAQWRSYPRRMMGRTTNSGVGDDMPAVGAAPESLLSYAFNQCAALDSARLLIESGADVAGRDRGQWTLLGLAAGCRDAVAVTAMLARGASPNATEPDGGTVLWEPTNLGWQRRAFEPDILAAMQQRGGTRPTTPPVRRQETIP